MNTYAQEFGKHVRSLRRARGVTQDGLGQRSGLSADTIRRLEHGNLSPTLDTLRKLSDGLNLQLSTLFESFELGSTDGRRELLDLVANRTKSELEMIAQIIRAVLDQLDAVPGELRNPNQTQPESSIE